MLIIHVVRRDWTKATRAAGDNAERLALPDVFPLTPPPLRKDGKGAAWLHTCRLSEWNGFALEAQAGFLPGHDADAAYLAAPNVLSWRLGSDHAELSLARPEGLTTAWPGQLPEPINTVRDGEVVRIDWNGRLLFALSGTHHQYYYQHDTYWAAWTREPHRDLFTSAQPRKHIDLRTRIY